MEGSKVDIEMIRLDEVMVIKLETEEDINDGGVTEATEDGAWYKRGGDGEGEGSFVRVSLEKRQLLFSMHCYFLHNIKMEPKLS